MPLKLKPLIQAEAKKNQRLGGKGSQKSVNHNTDTHTEQGYQKSDNPEHTAKELAKAAGVSHDTIHKVETIEAKAAGASVQPETKVKRRQTS